MKHHKESDLTKACPCLFVISLKAWGKVLRSQVLIMVLEKCICDYESEASYAD